MDVKIEKSWKNALAGEFEKAYFASLVRFLHHEKAAGKKIFPPGSQIFKAFELTPVDKLKVVILGQDPYHGPGQAHGLSFSVPADMPAPPSLKNIFKEIESDLGVKMSVYPNLEKWASQGVLLLNAVLTVQSGAAASHSKIGWEEFTDAAIKVLNEQDRPMVFILWGRPAQMKRSMLNNPKHLISIHCYRHHLFGHKQNRIVHTNLAPCHSWLWDNNILQCLQFRSAYIWKLTYQA